MSFEKPSRVENSDQTSTPPSTPGLTRRNFLFASGAAAVLASGVNRVVVEKEKIDKGKTVDDYQRDATELVFESELREKILRLKEEIRVRYNIAVVLDDREIKKTTAAYKAVTELRLTKQIEVLESLQTELSKYPDFLIVQYGLKRIVVTSQHADEENLEGGYVTLDNIDAAHDVFRPELVLRYDYNEGTEVPLLYRYRVEDLPFHVAPDTDLEKYRQEQNNKLFRRNIHHELGHVFLDVPGSEQTPRLEEAAFVAEWSRVFEAYNDQVRMLLKPEAEYTTSQGVKAVKFNLLQSRPPGFARGYGLDSEREDRATIIEEMMTYYGYSGIESHGDAILNNKISYLKKYYLAASAGLINDEYWEIVNRNKDKESTQFFFALQTERILTTPYAQSPYQEQVTEAEYESWQAKLKTTKIARDYNLVK